MKKGHMLLIVALHGVVVGIFIWMLNSCEVNQAIPVPSFVNPWPQHTPRWVALNLLHDFSRLSSEEDSHADLRYKIIRVETAMFTTPDGPCEAMLVQYEKDGVLDKYNVADLFLFYSNRTTRVFHEQEEQFASLHTARFVDGPSCPDIAITRLAGSLAFLNLRIFEWDAASCRFILAYEAEEGPYAECDLDNDPIRYSSDGIGHEIYRLRDGFRSFPVVARPSRDTDKTPAAHVLSPFDETWDSDPVRFETICEEDMILIRESDVLRMSYDDWIAFPTDQYDKMFCTGPAWWLSGMQMRLIPSGTGEVTISHHYTTALGYVQDNYRIRIEGESDEGN